VSDATTNPVDEPQLEIVGLPEGPDPATWVAETPSEPVPDSTGGRDPVAEFLLRP